MPFQMAEMKRKQMNIKAAGTSLADWLSRRRPGPLARETSPFLLEFFMVQGAGFKGMAYRNSDGKWRSAFDHIELPGTIRVLE